MPGDRTGWDGGRGLSQLQTHEVHMSSPSLRRPGCGPGPRHHETPLQIGRQKRMVIRYVYLLK